MGLGCRLANGEGLRADPNATIRLSNCHVTGNTSGLVAPGTFVTYGNNRILANGGVNTVPGAPAPTLPQ